MKQIDPSEINIISYLTGELTVEEMKKFKLQLDKNEVLREQVEEMKMIRSQLDYWKNDDIKIPPFEPMTYEKKVFIPEIKSKPKIIKFPNWMKYAVAFIGIILLLQLSGLKVNQDGNTLLLSFGEPTSTTIDVGALDEIVAKAVDTYAKSQNSQLIEFKNKMNSDLIRMNKAVDHIAVENKSSIAQLTSHFNYNLNKQYVSFESMIKGSEETQRQELEDSFTGLVEYMENKRIKDQHKIQNAFSDIAAAINNQQNQTNALLTSISEEDPGLKSY